MKYLFHASPKRGVKLIKPREKSFRNSREGPVIFATSSKAIASTFLVRWDDDWVEMGIWKNHPYLVVSDEKRFRKNDKGGSIYTLPKDSFSTNSNIGLGMYEWKSKKELIPLKEEVYLSGAEAMIKNGVRLYFVSKELLKEIKSAKDYGFSILKKLKPVDLSVLN